MIAAEEDTTDRLLLENEEYCVITLENETIYNERRTSVSNSLIDPITNAVVEQFIEDEPPEVSTEQFLKNDEYCVITQESKTMNTESRTAVPEIVVDSKTENQTPVEGDAIVQQFTEQLLENEEHCLIIQENKTMNSELRTAVPKVVVNGITEDRTSIEGNAVVQRFIKDEPFEASTELLVNEEYDIITLQKKSTNIEPKTSVPDNVIDTNKVNQILGEGNAIVQQFIKVEPPEAYTGQLLMNEDCCFVKSINESMKFEPKTIVPESSLDTIVDDQASIKVNAVIQELMEDDLPEIFIEKFLENEEYCVAASENETIKTTPNSAVSESVIDRITNNQTSVNENFFAHKFVKDEPPEISTEQLLLEKEICTVIESQSIKMEQRTDVLESQFDAFTNDRTSVEGIAQKYIKNEVSDATTEQLLLNNELYTITTLENKKVVTQSKTTVLKNLPKQNNYIKSLAESLVAAVTDPASDDEKVQITTKEKEKSDDETKIKSNVRKLLDILVDRITLTKFGWPQETEEYVLCRVIENCGYDLSKDKTSYVDCDYATRMRGYVKLLFSVVLHNDSILELLNYYPIDDVIKFVLDNDDND
ncbi:uncharacterized protein LOC119682259 [Teleopsis dalmanni]|uniref:uncharacterized protein LOC119682259 n=1 Tax=Teleopsis dalmanni TaxID=139649 RepID=UPI0018CFB432|nr:uncharacterized protein LOC119682259 [Teleopsis dalmanni]